jgi:catechol 2,3-dioxygenase-like lactoylglutathione lyase family enzyme
MDMSEAAAQSQASQVGPLTGLVPMIHVTDLERSIAFYRLLGFEVGNSVPPAGPMQWAWLYQPGAPNWKTGANLMITRTSRPLNPDAQDVFFYLYAKDLVALRQRLMEAGVKVSEISHPDYLPEGEFRMADPDGYGLMVAQSGKDTP